MTHHKACIPSDGDWLCAPECTHDAERADARAARIEVAAAALLRWYGANTDAMPAEWRIPHTLQLWSDLRAALEEA